jgi:predicted O-methyltransferase YrrM
VAGGVNILDSADEPSESKGRHVAALRSSMGRVLREGDMVKRGYGYLHRRRAYVAPARAVARRTGDPRARHVAQAARELVRPSADDMTGRIEACRRSLEHDRRPYRMSTAVSAYDSVPRPEAQRPDDYTVGEFTRAASVTAPFGAFLRRLVTAQRPDAALELGTASGISAAYIAAGMPRRFVTLEGDPAAAAVARELLARLGLRAEVRLGLFSDTLQDALEALAPVGFVYIDGHHLEEQTLEEWAQIREHLTSDAMVVWDDIDWSDGMKRVWRRVAAEATFVVEFGRFGVWAR